MTYRFARDLGFGATLSDDGRTRFRLWAPAQQEVAHRVLRRAAQEHPEHPAGVHNQRVGGARAASAQVLQVPPALQ